MTYRACVFGGVIAGVAIATLFASRAQLTPLLWIATAAFAVCVSLACAAITKLLLARERFSFLHYQLAVIAATSAILPQALDLLALALAITQSIGRLGCASVGCCHGRPARFGIRYRAGQVREHWIGARVIPVQVLESIALAIIAVFTARAIGTSGAAITTYALSYACVRFTTELLRGDARPHFRGLSEAQWICIATAILTATIARGFAIAIAATLIVAAILVANGKRRDFDKLARALHLARTSDDVIDTADVRISHGRTIDVEHYTLSLAAKDARAIASLVRDLAHPDDALTLLAGNGVFHLVVKRFATRPH